MAQGNTAPLLDEPQTGVKDVANVPAAQSGDLVLMFERLAKDPAVDVDKLQRLIDMQKEIMRVNAEAQFWDRFAAMQGELPTITEDGAIAVNGTVRSRYSTNENIQEVIRPILQRHGFALSFRNATEGGVVKVTGILAGYGHKETDTFEAAPDSGGSMNTIQRIGSTRSYGQRYTTIALLNIVSRAPQDRDDDGNRSEAPEDPDGLETWVLNMEAAVPNGTAAVMKAFNAGAESMRTHYVKHHRKSWESLKARAAEASTKGGRR
jgi:hypothetical protein